MQIDAAAARESWLTFHPLSAQDAAVMAALRVMVKPNKGKLRGTAARAPFDAATGSIIAPPGVAILPRGSGPFLRQGAGRWPDTGLFERTRSEGSCRLAALRKSRRPAADALTAIGDYLSSRLCSRAK
jgi:hypothetical protein